MSSSYPILDNRPINQWKVTELKEELKRRKLTTKGLKDELIRRLDEALRMEGEAAKDEEAPLENEAAANLEKDKANGIDDQVVEVKDSQTNTVVAEMVDTTERESVKTFETSEQRSSGVVEPIETENVEKVPEVVDQEFEHSGLPVGVESSNAVEEVIAHATTLDTTVTVTETVSTEVVSGQDSYNAGKNNEDSAINLENEESRAQLDREVSKPRHLGLPVGVESAKGEEVIANATTMETTVTVTETVFKEVVSGQDSYSTAKNNEDLAIKLKNEESRVQLDSEDSKPQLECDSKLPCDVLMPNSSAPENQVSEVNPSLGSQVKSDSISTDSLSINQKNELKDTIIANNVKLEQDIVRPEMVEEPSSRNDVPVYDESHSLDVGGLHEKKASVEENNNIVTSPDLNKTNSSDDVGYPEKLNLDRSSGDDSMEEDLPETKQYDSKFNVDELRGKVESNEVPIVKEESNTIVVGDGLSARKIDAHQDIEMTPVSLTEKRKHPEQVSVGNSEPAKRQRRWNTETVKRPDLQSTTPRVATTPKDEPITQKRNFSRSDSSVTDDTPKERIVPPSQRTPTNSLRIDRFLRPFTLKAVQELLGKTGNVSTFWMDQIKTHCYVTYSSIEEAIETRNAVYNLQWPPNGGRLLVAEYVEPEEVKMKLEAPPTQAVSVSSVPTVPPAPAPAPAPPSSQPEPSPRQHREQHPVPVTLPPPPPLARPPPVARERLPSPPPLPEKMDPPIVTLDDLFRKTTATPRIYYLPLSEEQVAAKLAAQGKSTRQ